MAQFPSTIPSFTVKVDGSSPMQASDINSPQSEIVAIATSLGINPPATISFLSSGSLPSAGTKGNLLVSNGTTWQKLAAGTNTYVLTADSSQTLGLAWAVSTGSGGGGSAADYIQIQEQQPNNTASGANSAGAVWYARGLNTIVSDSGSHVTVLTSGSFTLGSGTYEATGWMEFFRVDHFNCRLYDVTGAAVLLNGSAGYSSNVGNYVNSQTNIAGKFTLGIPSVLAFQYFSQTVEGTNGFGTESGAPSGPEVFADLVLRKVL